MAYGKKYIIPYCNTEGIACEVSLWEDEYVGSVSELIGAPVPFIKGYGGSSDFLFNPVRPSTGRMNIVFDENFSMEEFWTADEKKYQIQHTINAALDWVGFVIPNGFGYQLTGGLYYGQIVAADGLSTLKNIPFADSVTGEPYGTQDLTYNNGFEFPWILMATEILRKLDLNLNLWTCVDVYEQSMTKTGDTREADPLATSYANVKTYINDTQRKDIPYWQDVNEVYNCFEVLENLGNTFGAKIYQSGGVWRIKRINADANYGTGPTQRYWRKYNTLAVYLGQEIINKDVFIPCATIQQALIGTDHNLAMDDVYGAFRINYEYALLQIGDTPLELITNGNFDPFNETSKIAAPQGWYRWREGSNWHLAMTQEDISAESAQAGGNTTALKIGLQGAGLSYENIDTTSHPWNSCRHQQWIQVTKGDILSFQSWIKFQGAIGSSNKYVCLFRVKLVVDAAASGEAENTNYWLSNDTTDAANLKKLNWVPDDSAVGWNGDIFFVCTVDMMEGDINYGDFIWRNFKLDIQAVPKTGHLLFDIIGIGAYIGQRSDNFPSFNTYYQPWAGDQYRDFYTPRDYEFVDQGGAVERLRITGLSLGKIPDRNEFAEQQDYIYKNPGLYSLEVEPITVLNGDTPDPQHVSRIIVPTNTTDLKNFWDDIDGQYGPASIGLITCKSIMQQYIKPFRILEGTIKSSDVDIDTRFEFEAIPGKKFVLQKANFDEKRNYITRGTFREISAEAIPTGGEEGGNTLEPIWSPNGRVRCAKDGGNLNTGQVEIQETDINPNSETFGQTRWVDAGTDLAQCPLGEPFTFYWGCSPATLNLADLVNNTFYVDPLDPLSISMPFTNTGGDYIYLVHLQSFGLVESVVTQPQPEIISDFQYLADEVIDGFTYRVLRQNYPTTQFSNYQITFKFV